MAQKSPKGMDLAAQLVIAVVSVTIVGALVISFSEFSPEQKQGQAMIRAFAALSQAAREYCQAEIKNHLTAGVGDPSDSAYEGQDRAILTWNADQDQGEFKTISCTYENDKGVTYLAIDGAVKTSGGSS